MEKYRQCQKELYCVFVDLDKAYDKVSREVVWYCMRKERKIIEEESTVMMECLEKNVRSDLRQANEYQLE